MRRPWLLAALVVLPAALSVVAACGSSPELVGSQPVDRVLVVSLPGVGWADLRQHDLPYLEEFAEEAAVGDMSTRIGRRNATVSDAYLTIGSGTRAMAPDADPAVAVDPDDRYGGVATAELLERRLGYVPPGLAYLASGAARDVNEDSAFGAEVGLLGDVLAEFGVTRSVVANADAVEGFASEEAPPDGYYQRSAATALMGGNGIVPEGRVGRTLLVDDPAAPFGRSLDHDEVLAAFGRSWHNRDDGQMVVLVEASDLARASAYRGRALTDQAAELRSWALASSDELLGRLLEEVDPERDAVLVLSPVSPSPSPELGLVALQAPEVDPGLLQSATTRRDGYVHLADVAPTVTGLLGHEFPTDVEGRSFQVASAGGADRTADLVHSAEAAAFRDWFLPVFVTGVVVALVLLMGAVVARDHLPRLGARAVALAALVMLGILPATFLAGRIDPAHDSVPGHLAVVLLLGLSVALVAVAVDRHRPGTGLLVAVGSLVGLITLDALTGAVLQVNTLFGYSMAVAGRFTGLGNLALALYASGSILLAALLTERYGRRGLRAAALLLVGVVLVDGLPMLGPNVGGVVSMTPAFGVTLLLLARRTVGWREVLGLVGVTVGAVVAFAAVDAASPEASHSHLARLAEMLVDGQWSFVVTTFTRRWQASFGSLELAGWGTVLTALVLASAHTWVQVRRAQGKTPWPSSLVPADHQTTPTVAVVAGLMTFGTIGLVANDSSLAVPLTTLVVAVPVLVVRSMRTEQTEVTVAAATASPPAVGVRHG